MANVMRAAPLSNAAGRECALLGDTFVDLPHLFLALLATGGPASRALAQRGLDLESARAAVRRMEGDVDPDDDDPDTDSIQVDDLHYDVQSELPWTDRAGRLGPTPSSVRSDLGLLADLLDDESGIIADLVRSVGIDPVELRADLDTLGEAPEPVEDEDDVLPDDDLVPEAAVSATASIQHFIPEPLERVWSVVSDPRAVVRWLDTPERSRLESGWIETTVERFGTTGSVRLAPSIVEEPSPEGARIVWQERHFSDKVDGEPGGYYDIRLKEADHGTVLDLVRGVRTFGRISRALLPISRRTMAASLPAIAQDIAYASATD